MPERAPFDGPLSVRRIGDSIIVEATQGALTARVEMSEYNAWRVFGCLALLLEIPLPPSVSKAIKLDDGSGKFSASIGFPEPKTLGQRVAQNLALSELERLGLVTRDDDGKS